MDPSKDCVLLVTASAVRNSAELIRIGRLAAELRMSKSGLFAHFGSKQKLQLATIHGAQEIFMEEVLDPAQPSTKGIKRLWALCDLWLKHLEVSGYFFTGAFFEYGGRSGVIAGSLRDAEKLWFESLRKSAQTAQDQAQLNTELSEEAVALELNALLVGAYGIQLLGIKGAHSQVRTIILERLCSWAGDEVPRKALKSPQDFKKYLKIRKRHQPGPECRNPSVRF